MKFLNTEMHMVTFWIIMFELVMLFFQVIYFLQRTTDKKRLLYLILLVLLILYNACSGFFPDANIPMPVSFQTVIAFLVGFTMSMYVVYYFYKAFELPSLRFFATFGSIYFLLIPFIFFFVIPYYVTGDLPLARRLTVVIPFLYGIAFIIATTKALRVRVKKKSWQKQRLGEFKYEFLFTAYVALICWATLPVIVFFGDFQVLEHSVTNAGFLMMTIIYVRSSIHQARLEYSRLQSPTRSSKELIESNAKAYKLTSRELEIVHLVIEGESYKVIAGKVGISEKTVARHVSNVFIKVNVNNKVALINKITKAQYS